ncbi:MAG: hypothetical protein IKK92_02270 [Prevotella sp.]|nr:hypothetical protein [Prevotella sp.]MBQ2950451.1 hypothetical protein [Prevotella sp.]MBR6593387.1 hypothetical protein [Prevotella sp.]MBR6604690.1 hypothetical protein [Prevotella sp.]
MCKLENVKVGIRDLNFTAHRGKMLVRLTDGREIIVPVSFFPDIKQMSVKERNRWMILDDQYFTFENLTRVYSLLDLMRVA